MEEMPTWLSIFVSWLPMLIIVGFMTFFGIQLGRVGKILERVVLALEKKIDNKD